MLPASTKSKDTDASFSEHSESGDNAGHPLIVEDVSGEDLNALSSVYQAVRSLKKMKENYWYLVMFSLFTALFMTIIYLQANVLASYQLANAHWSLLPPGYVNNAPYTQFPSVKEIYSWINNSLINEIWVDPVCGNGICESPQEYPSWGDDNTYGCLADCGVFNKTTIVTVEILSSFDSEADMAASHWNLCLNDPISTCWFQKNQPFSQLSVYQEFNLSLPDGNWSLNVNASNGGLKICVFSAAFPPETYYGFGCNSQDQENSEKSNYATCRETCYNITENCFEPYCTPPNSTLTQRVRSAFYLECSRYCFPPNNVAGSLAHLRNRTCSKVIAEIVGDCDVGLPDIPSNGIGVGSTSTSNSTAVPRLLYRTALWEKLGPTDEDRLWKLYVAVQRSLYTWVRDECLVHHKKPISVQDRLTAFFCTFFGGPTTMDGCLYTYGGANLTTDSQLFQAMEDLHARMGLAQDQVDQFGNVLLWALQSVTRLDQATVVEFSARLRQLDRTVVTEQGIGCETVDAFFSLQSSIPLKSSYREVYQNDVIQWIWKDDDPHSVVLDNYSLSGFGSNELVVSRGDICTPQSVAMDAPSPCNLVDPSLPPPYAVKYTFLVSEAVKAGLKDLNFSSGNVQDGVFGEVDILNGSDTRDRSCGIHTLLDGKCNKKCNTEEYLFDGGDCACPVNGYGEQVCTCSPEQNRNFDTGGCSDPNPSVQKFVLKEHGSDSAAVNAAIIPDSTAFFKRTASTANSVLVGLLIQQRRKDLKACRPRDSRFSFLNTECVSESEKDRFGINPYALPSSSLFNSQYSKEVTNIYSQDPTLHNDTFSFAAKNTPYGFYRVHNQSTDFGFSYIFDIGLNNSQANVALTYLKDGIFLDENVDSLHVSLITHNSEFGVFTTVSIDCTFEAGGSITVAADSRSVTVEHYRTRSDWIRCALEIVFVVAVAATIWMEVHEYATSVAHTKSLIRYFNFGNLLDLLSIAFMVLAIGLWVHNVLAREQPFTVKTKYNMYSSPFTPYDAWRVSNTTEFESALEVFASLRAILNVRVLYFSTQGINLLLITLRLLKLMHFQPRLGTITRTLAEAAPDLFHFFIIAGVIFFSFAFFAHVVFGRLAVQFHTLWASLNTCFRVVIGNDDPANFLFQRHGWEMAAGAIFWWMFVIVVSFVVFNVLIAIVLDAYTHVKGRVESADSILEEVSLLLRNVFRSRKTHLTYEKQLQMLEDMGAKLKGDAHEKAKTVFSRPSFTEVPVDVPAQMHDRAMDLLELKRLIGRLCSPSDQQGSSGGGNELAEAIFNEMWRVKSGDGAQGQEGMAGASLAEDIVSKLEEMNESMRAQIAAHDRLSEEVSLLRQEMAASAK